MRQVGILILSLALTLCLSIPATAGKVRNRVQQSKVLRAGVGAKAAPFGFENKRKQWVGFDMDLAREIAKRLGARLELTPVDGADRVDLLRNGTLDICLAHMTHTRDRDKVIDFSITYFQDGQKILAKKGRFDHVKDFSGRKVAVAEGSSSAASLKRKLRELGDADPDRSVLLYPNEAACFKALELGEADGWASDSFILQGYSAPRPGEYEMVGEFISDEPYGIGLPQGDAAWRDTINFTLQDMWLDGTFQDIYDRWFGPDSWTYFPMLFKMEVWP